MKSPVLKLNIGMSSCMNAVLTAAGNLPSVVTKYVECKKNLSLSLPALNMFSCEGRLSLLR